MMLVVVFAHPVIAPQGLLGQVPLGGHLQTGPAGLPGLGFQVGYVAAQDFFTREITVVADLSSFRSDGNVHTAIAVGGAVRILGIARTIGNTDYRGFDLDLGVRVGPGLLFEFRESRAAKNRRFNLFLEPFVRWSTRARRALLFVEAGVQRPVLRAGFWIALAR